MKRQSLLIIALCMVCLCSVAAKAQTSVDSCALNCVKEFYVAYATDIAGSHLKKDESESIKKKHLTTALIEKTDRMTAQGEASSILRAQDFNDRDIPSISVAHLDDNWFMVSYVSSYNNKRTDIPVRTTRLDGCYMLDYITPEWNGEQYGDHLLAPHLAAKTAPIDNRSPQAFISSFYAAYTNLYAQMGEKLSERLASLRAKHLTERAVAQWSSVIDSREMGRHTGYDLLIDGFDFDPLWSSSLVYDPVANDTFRVSYHNESIIVKVYKENGVYRIDSIVE